MSSIFRAAKSSLILGAAAAVFAVTVRAQSPSVAPSEANHFIETPKGWVHPKTAWGDPDLTGVWPIAHGLNLVRSCPRAGGPGRGGAPAAAPADRKSTRLNSSHLGISYAVFCLKKKKKNIIHNTLLLVTDKHIENIRQTRL